MHNSCMTNSQIVSLASSGCLTYFISIHPIVYRDRRQSEQMEPSDLPNRYNYMCYVYVCIVHVFECIYIHVCTLIFIMIFDFSSCNICEKSCCL